MPYSHAIVSDITPNRATVEALGAESEMRNRYDRAPANWRLATVAFKLRVDDAIKVGDRVWIKQDSASRRIEIVAGE